MHDSNKIHASCPIAIIGMGMRFPKDIHDENAMWTLLTERRCAIGVIPAERWDPVELQHPQRGEPGRSVSFAAGVLDDIDQFDAGFFKISPREASWMDPQQRLLLQMAHEAMEDAGIDSENLRGTDCGVYVGISGMDYGQNALEDLASMTAHTMTGNTLSIAANRLSYFYDLHGPSLAIDTACSSGLAALHQACQALRNGEIPLALAGGINVLMHPYSFIGFSHASMLSARGVCRPFDASADGYVRGEGGALFLLKPLREAMRDGDHIHAVILGSGTNSDGARKNGLTIPSADAQVELMDSVLRMSGLKGADIDFVEAHGTGTPVGDPIEAKSIGTAYGKDRSSPLPISSAKANFGHLEPASGMVGMVKAILAIKHGILPPMPFDLKPNPAINFEELNIVCAADGMVLPGNSLRPLNGAVNSFGFGGLNAHVLLQGAPADANFHGKKTNVGNAPLPPLFIGARTEAALKALAIKYADTLEELPAAKLYDLAWNAAFGRSLMEKRLAVWATDKNEYVSGLRGFASGKTSPYVTFESMSTSKKEIAFIYSGNGAQWHGMGRQLFEESAIFARALTSLDNKMRPVLGWSILDILLNGSPADLEDTAICQPLLFAIQVCITIFLRELGIKPAATAGHSVGEVAAAWGAGALGLEEAIQIIHARSVAQGKTRGSGKMAAAGLGATDALAVVNQLGLDRHLEIAAMNSSGNCTISGDAEALVTLGQEMEARRIFFRQLDLEYAFHSRHMENVRDCLNDMLENFHPSERQDTGFVSTVTGQSAKSAELDPQYWWRNMRQPVNFMGAIQQISAAGIDIFVEIGPHAILQRYIRENLPDRNTRVLSTMQHGNAGLDRMRHVVASLHLLTARDGFSALFPHKGTWMPLPRYPWQNHGCWLSHTSEAMPRPHRDMPLLGWELPGSDPCREMVLDPRKDTWLQDHAIQGTVVFPAAGYVEIALEAARNWLDKTEIALEDFDISVPMVLDTGKAQTVRCSIHASDGSLTILSRPRLENSRWITHAKCRIVSPGPVPESTHDTVPSPRTMSSSELYALTDAQGLNYGSFFRRIEKLQAGANIVEGFLKHYENDNFVLDPGALDAAFHSLVALYAENGINCAYLPVGFGKLAVYGTGVPAKIRAAITKSGKRMLHADIILFDPQGGVVARISDCRFRELPASRENRQIDSWTTVSRLSPIDRDDSTAISADLDVILNNALNSGAGRSRDRQTWYQEILPRLEGAAFARFTELKAKRNDAIPDPKADAFVNWLLSLVENGPASEPESLQMAQIPDWRELWREAYGLAPHYLNALLPVARVLERLPLLIAGTLSPGELQAEACQDAIANDMNMDNPAYSGIDNIIQTILPEILISRQPGRKIHILEVSAYPSQMRESVKSILQEDQFHLVQLYPQSCSPILGQENRHGAHTKTAVPDCAQWLQEQARASEGIYDVAIVRQELHKSQDLLSTLQALYKLLKPGGILLIAERHPDWSADLLSGLNENWWHATEDGHIVSSRMSPADWKEILAASGLNECAAITEPEVENLEEGAFLLAARKPVLHKAATDLPSPHNWVLVHDKSSTELTGTVAGLLRKNGQDTSIAQIDAGLECIGENTVFICGFDDSPESLPGLLARMNQLVCKVHNSGKNSRLWLVTKGGALFSHVPAAYDASPVQGALAGFWRVLRNEREHFHARQIDFAPTISLQAMAKNLIREFLHGDEADEIWIRDDGRYVPEIIHTPAEQAGDVSHFRLDITQPGRLDNLKWSAVAPVPDLPPDAIEARVMATGLNFRDIMLAMGLLPEDALENGFAGPTFGLEFSGVVTRVGRDVKNLECGDRISGFAPACFSSHVITPASAVSAISDDMDFAAAAAFPTIFTTAWYALKHLAAIQPGESVLIHGAAGGVGLAAIQIARLLGATVFATAGTPEKRELLDLLGVDHIFDSRNLDFADNIITMTNGAGVDVVLNSLAGEAMRRSLGLLKPFGRFLELGKRDYVENTNIGLRPLKENISYFSIDVDQLLTAKPKLANQIFDEIMGELEKNALTAPPYRIFALDRIKEAFRTMQQAKHIGKIVVDMSGQPNVASSPAENDEGNFGGTWIISGGLSGFGLATAKNLARHGASHLVLASRRGAQIPDAEKIYEEFAGLGVKATLVACDFSDLEAVRKLISDIANTTPAINGIVHAAAIFDDRRIEEMDYDAFEKSVSAKLTGAWNLHIATSHLPLRHFILYSSISVALGNPGQANYVAANAGLEALTQHRLAHGLPATCLAWGPIGDTGYLARNTTVQRSLASQLGGDPLTTEEAMREFNRLAHRDGVHVISRINWGKALHFLEKPPARLIALHAEEAASLRDENRENFLDTLKTMETAQAQEKLIQCVTEQAARVLGLNPEMISRDRNLQSLGLDSLMAMELALSIEQSTGLRLPPMLLQDAPTLEQLAQRLLERISVRENETEEKATLLAGLAQRHSETLAEDEVRDVLSDIMSDVVAEVEKK